jgi:transposase
MQRWRGCLLPPADAEQRDRRLARDLERYRILRDDIAALGDEIAVLLAATDGQILTPCPASRSCGLPHSPLTVCPSRFPDAEHLYSTTGLAPALYQSATLRRHGRISRQGLAEHRDALMGIAWGLSLHSPSFAERDTELRARGMTPIQARVALASNASPDLPTPGFPTTLRWRALSSSKAQPRTVTAALAMPLDGAT